MSEMKSSILQRAEAAAYDFDDDDDQPHYSAQKGRDVAFEDDEDGIDEGSVVYVRDGDESQEGNSDDDSEEDRAKERVSTHRFDVLRPHVLNSVIPRKPRKILLRF